MFVNRMLSLTSARKFKDLTKNQYYIINDQAMDYEFYKFRMMVDSDKPSFFEKFIYDLWPKCIYSRLERLLFCKSLFIKVFSLCNKKIFIIYPDSFFKIMWDFFILILLVLNILYIPLKLSFTYHKDF